MNPNKNRAITAITAITFSLIFSTPVFAATETHTVQNGESLWVIAAQYELELTDVIAANPQIETPDLIRPGDQVTIPGDAPSAQTQRMEAQVVALVNEARGKYGLTPLTVNETLVRVARRKSDDMRDSNYFAHQSPTYGSPFDMIKSFDLTYKHAGENIAKGQKTAQAVMDAWMASKDHRENILSPDFTEIGVGYAEGDATYWTQLFLEPKS